METINTEQLRKKIEMKKDLHLVSVENRDEYMEEHIPGSINIPLERLAFEATENFEKSEEIVVYSRDRHCTSSSLAKQELEELGFENVKNYEAGTRGWKDKGMKIVTI